MTPHTFGIADTISVPHPKHPDDPARRKRRFLAHFYRLETRLRPTPMTRLIGAPPIADRRLVPCAVHHPDMCLISTRKTPQDTDDRLYYAWEALWLSPPRFDAAMALNLQSYHAERVARGFLVGDASIPKTTASQQPLSLSSPLSNHIRLRVQAWILDCQAKAAAWIPS